MSFSEAAVREIERILHKLPQKFTADKNNLPLTDIYLQVRQESGEMRVYDDDDRELARCVVEEWIGNNSDLFYNEVEDMLRFCIQSMKTEMEQLNILRPFSFVLQNDEREMLAELYLVDDDLLIVTGDLMEGLDEELNEFWKHLSE